MNIYVTKIMKNSGHEFERIRRAILEHLEGKGGKIM